MADVTIKINKNGSYRVEGKVQMIDVDGNPLPFDKEKFSLCRCGHSSNKPFCDRTHEKIGFVADQCYVPKPTV